MRPDRPAPHTTRHRRNAKRGRVAAATATKRPGAATQSAENARRKAVCGQARPADPSCYETLAPSTPCRISCDPEDILRARAELFLEKPAARSPRVTPQKFWAKKEIMSFLAIGSRSPVAPTAPRYQPSRQRARSSTSASCFLVSPPRQGAPHHPAPLPSTISAPLFPRERPPTTTLQQSFHSECTLSEILTDSRSILS